MIHRGAELVAKSSIDQTEDVILASVKIEISPSVNVFPDGSPLIIILNDYLAMRVFLDLFPDYRKLVVWSATGTL